MEVIIHTSFIYRSTDNSDNVTASGFWKSSVWTEPRLITVSSLFHADYNQHQQTLQWHVVACGRGDLPDWVGGHIGREFRFQYEHLNSFEMPDFATKLKLDIINL